LLLAFACTAGLSAFEAVIPWAIGEAIDSVTSHGEPIYFLLSAGLVTGASLMKGILSYGGSFFNEVVSQKSAYDIRNAIYDKLQRLSFSFHDKSQTGQLMSRATVDVEAVRMFMGMGLLSLVQLIFLFIIITAILVSKNWKLALLSLSIMPLIGFRTATVGLRLRPIWLKVQQTLGAMGTTLEENLTGVRIVKSFCHEQGESKKFLSEANQLYDAQIDAARLNAINMPLMTFLVSVPTALILWYGGLQVMEGSLTIGGLTSFVLYLGRLVMPIRRLGFLINMFSRTISAGERIFEILDAESPVKDRPGAIELNSVKGQVRFENVSFGYDSTGRVLKNINFKVQPGELVALVGSLGSGKSTLAHLIPRFYDVSDGTITVDGTDIRDVTLSSIRKNIGIVQQDIFIFSATIRDNIAYGVSDTDMKKIVAAAKASYLHDFVQSLPDGYDTWVGERGITLSGGEKQRLAIARTLLTDPSILILDDSTSSVDARIEYLIRQALDRLIKDRTTFIITHRLPIIKSADLILVLDEGRIVAQGKHDELMAKKGIYKQIYQSQLSGSEDSGEKLIEE